jgi:hypothetical protein
MGYFAGFNVSGFERLKLIAEGSKCTNIWKKTTPEINFSRPVG